MKNTCLKTLVQHVETLQHKLLKDKDDIDALCPTDSSPK